MEGDINRLAAAMARNQLEQRRHEDRCGSRRGQHLDVRSDMAAAGGKPPSRQRPHRSVSKSLAVWRVIGALRMRICFLLLFYCFDVYWLLCDSAPCSGASCALLRCVTKFSGGATSPRQQPRPHRETITLGFGQKLQLEQTADARLLGPLQGQYFRVHSLRTTKISHVDVFIQSRRHTACWALTWPTVTALFGTLGQMGAATAAHLLQRKRCRSCTLLLAAAYGHTLKVWERLQASEWQMRQKSPRPLRYGRRLLGTS